jgi:hypothetical protein
MLLDPNKQITKPIRCPDCWADMDFLGVQLNRRVFLSTILERHFFVCPNCGHLGYEIVLRPKEFIRFEAARFSQIDSQGELRRSGSYCADASRPPED